MDQIVDVMIEAGRIITEIKKCVSLYHFCNNRKLIYDYLLKDIYYLDAPEVLADFTLNLFSEESSLDVLKVELLKVYKNLTKEFRKLLDEQAPTSQFVC